MTANTTESRIVVGARYAVGAVIIIGLLMIGYSAPVATMLVEEAVTEPAPLEGNGPTGYFPDMFVNEATEIEPQAEAF